MTHDAYSCYKAKVKGRESSLEGKRRSGLPNRTKSFKGAVLGEKKNTGAVFRSLSMRDKSDGAKKVRETIPKPPIMEEPEKGTGEVGAEGILSAKKLRHPLF